MRWISSSDIFINHSCLTWYLCTSVPTLPLLPPYCVIRVDKRFERDGCFYFTLKLGCWWFSGSVPHSQCKSNSKVSLTPLWSYIHPHRLHEAYHFLSYTFIFTITQSVVLFPNVTPSNTLRHPFLVCELASLQETQRVWVCDLLLPGPPCKRWNMLLGMEVVSVNRAECRVVIKHVGIGRGSRPTVRQEQER